MHKAQVAMIISATAIQSVGAIVSADTVVVTITVNVRSIVHVTVNALAIRTYAALTVLRVGMMIHVHAIMLAVQVSTVVIVSN
jgi:hypothetical protein